LSLLNLVGQPPRFRANGSVTWSRGGLTSAATVNYINSYTNNLATPNEPISSWTTADLYLSYEAQQAAGLFSGLQFSLSIRNLFDEAPPFVRQPSSLGLVLPLAYDPQNADPLGRVISFTIRKRW
jgi:hypothetical protein